MRIQCRDETFISFVEGTYLFWWQSSDTKLSKAKEFIQYIQHAQFISNFDMSVSVLISDYFWMEFLSVDHLWPVSLPFLLIKTL